MKVLGRETICALLRPMVQFFLRRGVRLPELLECLKIELVSSAAELLEQEERKASVSAISLRAGVSRREVHRLYKRRETQDKSMSIPARVLYRWQQDKDFCTKAGKPRVLSVSASDSEFSELVRRVTGDIHAAAVADELEVMGLVEYSSRGIKLTQQQFTPAQDMKQLYELLAKDLGNFIEAVGENIETDQSPTNIHSTTFCSALPISQRDQIRELIIDETSRYHRRLVKLLADFDQGSTTTSAPPANTFALNVTSFSKEHLQEVPRDDEQEKSAQAPNR